MTEAGIVILVWAKRNITGLCTGLMGVLVFIVDVIQSMRKTFILEDLCLYFTLLLDLKECKLFGLDMLWNFPLYGYVTGF